jgi:hypothetical protein
VIEGGNGQTVDTGVDGYYNTMVAGLGTQVGSRAREASPNKKKLESLGPG